MMLSHIFTNTFTLSPVKTVHVQYIIKKTGQVTKISQQHEAEYTLS